MGDGLFGVGEGFADLAAVRSLRADPPGKAGDGKRRKTFDASLEQFEQMLEGGRAMQPASAPILLHYALAQAGRAILAAHAPQPWEVHGHGLRIEIDGSEIMDTRIKPAGSGLFQAVAKATGSDPLAGEISLAEAWAGIPNLPQDPRITSDAGVLFLARPWGASMWIERQIATSDGQVLASPDDFIKRVSDFPALTNARGMTIQRQAGWGVRLVFERQEDAAAFDDLLWPYQDQRYLRFIAGSGSSPSALLSWWMLLQGLSQLARYSPAAWTAAISPAKSRIAVPLEQTLEIGAAVVPGLILGALSA